MANQQRQSDDPIAVQSTAELKEPSRPSTQTGIARRVQKLFVARRRSEDLSDPSVERDASVDIDVAPETNSKPPLLLVSFVLLVLLPFIASGLYHAFIASDQFISEARFAVRSVAAESGENVDSGVMSMSTAPQDAYVVTSFIHSTEILKRLSGKVDYVSLFSGSDVDFLSRLESNSSQEELLKFWDRQIQTYIDGPSGIITLKVRAFDAENAKRLAALILAESDILVNELSQRAKADIIKRSQEEVLRTEENYKATLAALTEYQRSAGIFNPKTQASSTGELLGAAMARSLTIESRIFVLNSSAASDSPAYRQLVQEKAAVEAQIDKLKAEMTGGGEANNDLSNALARFSALETDRVVGEKLYESARAGLAAAQIEALKKAIYLIVFVEPELPQDSLYPNRVSSPFILLLVMFVVWCTLVLAWASVEDHRL
ncbi:capsule biosynthesis protein [Rhizobium puerariae]|uniref:Capsule biosynthesis protein n=1 Tax=Rhizobium puerariae TaxID=1585791 RepID=A0ABV6ARE7_9HYPH